MQPNRTTRLFGLVVRKRRERQNLSQEKLAYRAKLNPGYISRLERGLREPKLGTIVQIAEGLDTSLPTLMSDLERRLKR